MMRQVSDSDGTVTITQGEYVVSRDSRCIMSTILGSCVSTCFWDPDRKIGGMNHVLIARSGTGGAKCDAAGVNAMELLINALVRAGADRRNLHAKVFGGARMIDGLSDIGKLNGVFTLEFLAREGIPCVGQSLGGTSARQVKFFPAEGKALVKSITTDRPVDMPHQARPLPAGNGVEFF